MRYFSMFSGIGGFELGIQRSTGKRWECVGFSEIDKYSISTYLKNFPSHKNYGNAKDIDPAQLPDFDLLCGGFPCQAFSIAGKRMGFEDTRGTLFFDIARIAKVKRPQFILLENVKGLLSHDKGRTFGTILATLDEMGYNAEWEVLNSKYFGVPQNRERVFIVGHLRSGSSRQVFPIGENDQSSLETDKRKLQETKIARTITSTEFKQHGDGNYVIVPIEKDMEIKQVNQPISQTERVYSSEGLSPTLPSRGENTGTNTPIIQVQEVTGNRQGYRAYSPEGISPTLNSQSGGTTKDRVIVVGSLDSDGWEKRHESIRRVYSPDGIAPTIPTATGGGIVPKIISHSPRSGDSTKGGTGSLESSEHCFTIDSTPHNFIMMVQPVLTPNRPEKRQNGRRMKESGDPMFTLTGQDVHGVMIQEKCVCNEGKVCNICCEGCGNYKEQCECNTLTYRHSFENFKGYTNLSPPIKSSQGSGNQILVNKIRRLTPTECERL